MANNGTKPTTKEFATNDQANYYSGITSIKVNGKNAYELKGKFLDDLHNNAFSRTNREDAVDHIEYFLRIVDPIDLPNVNQDKLRVLVFPISLVGDACKWFDKIKGSINSWVDLTVKFFRKYYPPSYTRGALWDYWKMGSDDTELTNEKGLDLEEECSRDVNETAKIFKIKDDLLGYETPLYKAFNKFNYLLKIDKDLFTFEIQEIKTYEEYELDNNMTGELEEPWSENGIPYQLCDHICEPYHFKNGMTKWPTCSLDIDGFYNGGELPGMVNAHEKSSFARWENYGQGPYANAKTKKDYDPHLDNNCIFEKNYKANNVGDTQDTKKERHDPSICNIRRFEMIKYSFRDDEEYVAIKENKYDDLTHTSKEAIHAYQEIFRMMDEGWMVTRTE
ncbi:hypothetical protein Tco_0905679 [Tanacetum coccineum]